MLDVVGVMDVDGKAFDLGQGVSGTRAEEMMGQIAQMNAGVLHH